MNSFIVKRCFQTAFTVCLLSITFSEALNCTLLDISSSQLNVPVIENALNVGNEACWIIKRNLQYPLAFHLNSYNFWKGKFEIYDGNKTSGLLLQTCVLHSNGNGCSPAGKVYSRFSPEMWIYFSQNPPVQFTVDFVFSLTAVDSSLVCGNKITLPDVNGRTRVKVTKYRDYLAQCMWYIETDPGQRVELDLSGLIVIDPSFSSLEVFDGFSNNYQRMLANVTYSETYNIVSTTESLTLVFTVHQQAFDPMGFNGYAKIYQGNNGPITNFTAYNGFILSPNFPYSYPANQVVIYNIYRDNVHYSYLKYSFLLQYFDLGQDSILNVSAVNSPSSGYTPIRSFHGNVTVPQSLNVQAAGLRLTFTSSQNTGNHTGFRAVYSSQCMQETQIESMGAQYRITSPGFPNNNYPSSWNCLYRITSRFNGRIKITFSVFDTESNYDQLKIFDGYSTLSTKSLGIFSGEKSGGFFLYSQSNKMTLQFITDSTNTKKGFSALVQYSDKSQDGPYSYTGHSFGVLMSPYYPSNYHSYETVFYYITVGSNQNVALTITRFYTETDRDFLRVYNGLAATTTPRFSFSGSVTNLPRTVYSNGRYMTLKFTSDNSVEYYGFYATYSASNISSCGETIDLQSSSTQTIQSPYYPQKYGNNENCIWHITCNSGKRVTITINAFDTEASHDYLKVYSGGSDDTSSLISTFSGSLTTDNFYPIHSGSDAMTIKFTSDYSYAGNGFSATLSVSEPEGSHGNFHLSKNNGYIMSPNFPQNYPHNSDVTWTIQVDSDYKIALTFTSFDTESGNDFVKFYDDSVSSSNLIESRYGSYGYSFTVYSCSNKMIVRFTSDSSIEETGFVGTYTKTLYYSSITCSGIEDRRSYNYAGAVVGIVFGTIGVVALVALIVVFIRRRRMSNRMRGVQGFQAAPPTQPVVYYQPGVPFNGQQQPVYQGNNPSQPLQYPPVRGQPVQAFGTLPPSYSQASTFPVAQTPDTPQNSNAGNNAQVNGNVTKQPLKDDTVS